MYNYSVNCSYSNPINNMGNNNFSSINTPFQFASSTCNVTVIGSSTSTEPLAIPVFFENATTVASSSEIIYANYMTAGDVLQLTFYILFTAIICLYAIAKGFGRLSMRRKYLQYNGGDVENRTDL